MRRAARWNQRIEIERGRARLLQQGRVLHGRVKRQDVDPKNAAEALKVVETIYALPDDIVEAARQVTTQ